VQLHRAADVLTSCIACQHPVAKDELAAGSRGDK